MLYIPWEKREGYKSKKKVINVRPSVHELGNLLAKKLFPFTDCDISDVIEDFIVRETSRLGLLELAPVHTPTPDTQVDTRPELQAPPQAQPESGPDLKIDFEEGYPTSLI